MLTMNQLLYDEDYKEENQSIYFWVVPIPPCEQQREKIKERLPEDVAELFNKTQLSCEKHIIQYPATMRGKNGILVSYTLKTDDVMQLCAATTVTAQMQKAVFDWLRDVAAYGESIELAGDMNAQILIGCGTSSESSNEICLFIPSSNCISRSAMEQVSDRLVRFMKQEYQNCLRIKTRAGRLILLRDDER